MSYSMLTLPPFVLPSLALSVFFFIVNRQRRVLKSGDTFQFAEIIPGPKSSSMPTCHSFTQARLPFASSLYTSRARVRNVQQGISRQTSFGLAGDLKGKEWRFVDSEETLLCCGGFRWKQWHKGYIHVTH